jgi:hypothetical protein
MSDLQRIPDAITSDSAEKFRKHRERNVESKSAPSKISCENPKNKEVKKTRRDGFVKHKPVMLQRR